MPRKSERFQAVARGIHPIPLARKQDAHDLEDIGVVVGKQDACLVLCLGRFLHALL